MKFMVTSRKGAAAAVAFLLASPIVALTGVGAGVAQAGVLYGPTSSTIASSLFFETGTVGPPVAASTAKQNSNTTYTDTFSISLNPASPIVGNPVEVSFSGTLGSLTGPVAVNANGSIVRVTMAVSGSNSTTLNLATGSGGTVCDYPATRTLASSREGPYTATGTYTPSSTGSTTFALKQIYFDDMGNKDGSSPKVCNGTSANADVFASDVTQTLCGSAPLPLCAGSAVNPPGIYAPTDSVVKNAPAASSTIKATVEVKPQTEPGKPSAPTAVAGVREATVSWSAATDTGGSVITDYTVTTVEDPTKTCTPIPGTGLTCTVDGLTNGTAYTFTLVATNAIGDSAASDPSVAVTTFSVPGKPTAVTATPGYTDATVSWTAPGSNGGSAITGYTVSTVEDPTKTCTPAAVTTLSCKVTGLSETTPYTFVVLATNAVGDSAVSDPSSLVTTKTIVVPDAPVGVGGASRDQSAEIVWREPASDGGAAITLYTVTTVGDPTKTCSVVPGPVTDLSCTVTGLTNGTAYTFTVIARNNIGDSLPSAASDPVTPRLPVIPDPPAQPTGVRGNGQVTLTWVPGADGFAPITSYKVTAVEDSSKTCTPTPETDLSCAVTGLTNGTPYTFKVTATNSVGTSVGSVASLPVTPATTPSKPGTPTVADANAEVAVSWTAPGSNGGSAITGYTVKAVGDPTKTCTPTVITTLSCTVNGLTNGTAYTFTVVANNDVGPSAPSDASSSATPATAPGTPAAPTAAAGNAQATVTWAAATDIGGSAITGYTVSTVEDPTKTCTPAVVTTLSCTVTGLTNGTAYTFTLVATNRKGPSSSSDASEAITPEAPAPTQDIPSTVSKKVAGVKCQNVTGVTNWTDGDTGGYAEAAGLTPAPPISDPTFTVALTPAAPIAGQKVTIAVSFDKGITNGPSAQTEGKTRPSARVLVTGALTTTIIVNGTPYGTVANPVNQGQRFPGQTMTKANAFTFPADASATNPVFVKLETIAFDTKSAQPDFNWPNGPADTFLTVCNKSANPTTATSLSGSTKKIKAQAGLVAIGVTAAVPFVGEVPPPPTIPPVDDNGGGGGGTDTSGGTLPKTGGNPISSLWVALILFQIGLIMAVRSVRAAPVKTARHL